MMEQKDGIAVEVEALERRFGNFTAVNKISFSVGQGEIFGFLGPNGAGKSTTIRMLCGLLSPSSGKGQVGGFDIFKEQEKIKENIGYMSQKFSLYDDLTVEENINFYGGLYRIQGLIKIRDEIIKKANLEGFRRMLTKNLSGGWKQRLALVCAVMHKPRIIFLDEPTSGVDPITRNTFWNIIKTLAKNGVTVFVTTHYMDEAENCNRMALIYKGNMIAMGTPHEMKTKFMKNEVLEIYVDDSENWAEKIKTLDGVKETALFGSGIHAVALDSTKAIPAIKREFEKEKAKNWKVNKIEASLEDVFVALIEDYDREHPVK